MKILTLIAHNSCQQDLTDSLRSSNIVNNFIFTHVEYHGTHIESDPNLSARDLVVGYIPKIRLDILIEDSKVDMLLALIKKEQALVGHSTYWITQTEHFEEL